MANLQTTQKRTIKGLMQNPEVQKRFSEMLGARSNQFITSVLQVANSNKLLQNATPESIYGAALTAASLDLPINQNLGFAYIVPYGKEAQFQIGYKGFIQLAQRSGQFKRIAAAPIHDGQIVSNNPLTGYEFDFSVHSDKVVGYAAYFELLNGFTSTFYMSVSDIEKHAKKYSQTYKKGFGNWKDNFDAMAQKTVLKLLLSKYAPLSTEMQKAVEYDQAKVNENGDIDYVDNTENVTYEEVSNEKEINRILKHIEQSDTVEKLEQVQQYVFESENEQIEIIYNRKLDGLKNAK